jgi:putative transposase
MGIRGILSIKGEKMPRKRITIKLSEQDEKILKKYVSQGHKNAREINRARMLLMANEGRKVKDIEQTLGVSQTTICNVRKNYNRGEHAHILDFIKDKPRSGRPLKLDSRVEAKVSMIACSDPPAGAARWTLHMIADKLVKLEEVESISHESVRQLLKKTNSSPG